MKTPFTNLLAVSSASPIQKSRFVSGHDFSRAENSRKMQGFDLCGQRPTPDKTFMENSLDKFAAASIPTCFLENLP
jgi:hypothetical protein